MVLQWSVKCDACFKFTHYHITLEFPELIQLKFVRHIFIGLALKTVIEEVWKFDFLMIYCFLEITNVEIFWKMYCVVAGRRTIFRRMKKHPMHARRIWQPAPSHCKEQQNMFSSFIIIEVGERLIFLFSSGRSISMDLESRENSAATSSL